jgi:hypothetical protein
MIWFQYRDPLSEVLDYIVEVRPSGYGCSCLIYLLLSGPQKKSLLQGSITEGSIAIAHDDDLQHIGDVVSPSQYSRIEITSKPVIHAPRKP